MEVRRNRNRSDPEPRMGRSFRRHLAEARMDPYQMWTRHTPHLASATTPVCVASKEIEILSPSIREDSLEFEQLSQRNWTWNCRAFHHAPIHEFRLQNLHCRALDVVRPKHDILLPARN